MDERQPAPGPIGYPQMAGIQTRDGSRETDYIAGTDGIRHCGYILFRDVIYTLPGVYLFFRLGDAIHLFRMCLPIGLFVRMAAHETHIRRERNASDRFGLVVNDRQAAVVVYPVACVVQA